MQTVIEVKVVDLMILFILALVLMGILSALLYVAVKDYSEWRRYKARAKKQKREVMKNETWVKL